MRFVLKKVCFIKCFLLIDINKKGGTRKSITFFIFRTFGSKTRVKTINSL